MARLDHKALNELRDHLRRPFTLYTSDFLDEREQAELLPLLKRCGREYRFDGGYEDAARRVLVLAPEGDYVEDYPTPIASLVFDKPCELNHRNVLGTMMSLGVDRDTVGDIAIWDETVQVVVLKRLQEYFLNNLRYINGQRIEPEGHSYRDIIPFYAPYDSETGTAASNRVDAVLATAFKTSRKKALAAIRERAVLLNHLVVTKPTLALESGDTLSVRGKGKIKITKIGERTKKGRIRFDYLRYK